MHLVQLLLPVYDNAGAAFPKALYEDVRRELVDRFGGITTYSRAPAKGLWRDGGGVDRDDIVVYEVMADALDRAWWAGYRASLEQRFAQDEVVVRALAAERL
ncbi:hypothetical protein [Piscinibacter koreensis]|uniref:DUF1330 domain-containing protein n=1 Tax=Piscinibacter koreensis TaxID=2742824 RepID=A0A7Y6NNU3_9BURK|nr:hypothetical protein [Schlegelella koreensis]NUZ06616.1 hypothetical protein [Schlegelella koreensis]